MCYDCGMHYDDGDSPDLRTRSFPARLRTSRTLRTMFSDKMRRKQLEKSNRVLISRYYQIVSPANGTIRQHQHTRGSGVAEDCRHLAFSEEQLALCAAPIESLQGEDTETTELSESFEAPSSHSLPHVQEENALVPCEVADEIVRRGAVLVNSLEREVGQNQDCLDSKWEKNQPKIPGDEHRGIRQGRLISWLLGGSDGQPEINKLLVLLDATEAVLRSQPIVSEVDAPAKIFGDVHGQFRDLLLLFHFYGQPGQEEKGDDVPVSYVFNGDWVDRGMHQLEVVALLFAYKVRYPDLVWLNRGNHEDQNQNFKTSSQGGKGFDRACDEAYGMDQGRRVFIAFHKVFSWLPLVARVDNRVLVLHGGLGEGNWTLDELREVDRPLVSEDLSAALNGVVYNILWSDPVQHTDSNKNTPQLSFGVHKSHRSKHTDVMKVFGRDVTERFCRLEGLALIVRSHQFKNPCKGYEIMHDGWLMRVFSARNYNGRVPNDGAILLIGRAQSAPETLLVRPQVIERLHRQATTAFSSLIQSEPYCPVGHLMLLQRPRPLTCMDVLSRSEDENRECSRCGAEELGKDCFFHCGGCGTKAERSYDICLACADAMTSGGQLAVIFDDDSEPGDFSDDTQELSMQSADSVSCPAEKTGGYPPGLVAQPSAPTSSESQTGIPDGTSRPAGVDGASAIRLANGETNTKL